MIILLFASVLLWGKRIDEGDWMIALLPAFVEIMIELMLIGSYFGIVQ